MIEVELHDGNILEFPEGTNPSVIQDVVRSRLQPKSGIAALGGAIGQGVGNVALGAQNLLGAGLEKLGAESVGEWLQRDAAQGKAKLAAEIAPYESQYPATVAGGRLAGEVIGTLPVGGVLSKGVQSVAGGLGASKSAAPIVEALRTGGMSAGRQTGVKALGTRMLGGAATGGTAAALVNPNESDTGALIGAALPIAGAALSGGVSGARRALGATTGAGDEALRVAFESGRQGGQSGQAFIKNLRGQVPMTDVLDDARANLETLRQARSNAYRQNMAAVQSDKSVLDMAPVFQSVQDTIGRFTFKGKPRDPQVFKALQAVEKDVSAWGKLNPAEFHTPEGLDALKQRIGSIRDALPIEDSASRAAVDSVYNSVKKQIEQQASGYAKAMRDYTQASELISEIQKSLLGNNRTSADTAMRKLQSIMRNNVNTNYGARADAFAALEQGGGRPLAPQLAGQALNDWLPRGIQRGTGALGTLAAGSMAGIPGAAGMAAISSPRFAGEAAYLAGQGANVSAPMVRALRSGAYRAAPVVGAQ